MAGVTYRDAIVIYRVITSDELVARQFLAKYLGRRSSVPDGLVVPLCAYSELG